MTDSYTFKLGVNLSETGESFERAVELAQELGAGYAEFFVNDRAHLSAAGAAPYRRRLEAHGLLVHGIGCTPNPFKELHIDKLDLADIPTHPTFRHDLDLVRRSIDFCQGVGGANVRVHGFAWPGEYQQGQRVSPTWPQRYATGGGRIPPETQDKLVKAWSSVAELAERHATDIAIGMMPWNYTNTSHNFCRIMARVGSPRLRCRWGPADNYNSGEVDTITAGYRRLKPYLTSLHLKDLRVQDGPACRFAYVPVGDGDVDYAALFRTFAHDHTDIVIAVATHYQPPDGTRADAMRQSYTNMLRLVEQAQAAVTT